MWERAAGEGPGVLLAFNKEGSRRRDFEGGRGGGGSRVREGVIVTRKEI